MNEGIQSLVFAAHLLSPATKRAPMGRSTVASIACECLVIMRALQHQACGTHRCGACCALRERGSDR